MKRFLLHLAPLPVLVACIYPFAWMFFSSFKTNREIYRPAQLLPEDYEWDSYSALWSGEYLPFLDYFMHSILVSGGQAILATLVTAAAGFAFAKFGFRGSGWLFGVAVLVILVPKQALAVPLSNGWRGWAGRRPLVADSPGVASGLGVIFFTQVFRKVPGNWSPWHGWRG